MAVSVTEGVFPIIKPSIMNDESGRRQILAERQDKMKREAMLKEKARLARLLANDARDVMRRSRASLEEMTASAKRDPQSGALLIAVREAAAIYANAAAEFLAADYNAEFFEAMAGGADKSAANQQAGAKITPTFEDVRKEVKKIETECKKAETANLATISESRLMGRIAAEAELLASAEKVSLLYALARGPESTAEDADNLLSALSGLKIKRKQAYVVKRDQRIEELMAEGHSEDKARDLFAKELRAERKKQEPERRERIAQERKMRVFGCDLKEACTGMADVIATHSTAKADRKAAGYARDVARSQGDMGGLREAVTEHKRASTKMALAVFKEMTYQNIKQHGIPKSEAREMALKQFRAEHERRIGMNVEQKKQLRRAGKLDSLEITTDMPRHVAEWRMSWNKYRHDVNLLKAEDRVAAEPQQKAVSKSHPAHVRTGQDPPGRRLLRLVQIERANTHNH